jgi:hypothetical protein
MGKTKRKSQSMTVRVSEHRARLREQGLKPVQIWVPDTSSPRIREELLSMCREIENYPGAEDDRAFIYALAEDAE